MSRLPTRGVYPDDWDQIARQVKGDAAWKCVRCKHDHAPAVGRCLTVHHFDGDKANCARWNLMSLCQACHLSVQGRVNPETPFMFTPATWSMPFISGFYEAGRGIIPASYDLSRWIKTYEREVGPWPTWAPVAKEVEATS